MESGVRAERKYWIALGLYGVLAALVWVTLGEGKTLVFGRMVEIRWIPEFVLGMFVFRTYVARTADRIRRSSLDASREETEKL
jgi:hypothetical protein